MAEGNGHDKRDTQPALPPDAPDWAHTIYGAVNQLNQSVSIIVNYLRDPATHRRLLLSIPLYEPEPSDEVTSPGYAVPDSDGDPGPRN